MKTQQIGISKYIQNFILRLQSETTNFHVLQNGIKRVLIILFELQKVYSQRREAKKKQFWKVELIISDANISYFTENFIQRMFSKLQAILHGTRDKTRIAETTISPALTFILRLVLDNNIYVYPFQTVIEPSKPNVNLLQRTE